MTLAKRKVRQKPINNSLFDDIMGLLPDNWADQCELADKADVSAQTVWMWANGYTKSPRITTLVKVATALGYDIGLSKIRTLRLVR